MAADLAAWWESLSAGPRAVCWVVSRVVRRGHQLAVTKAWRTADSWVAPRVRYWVVPTAALLAAQKAGQLAYRMAVPKVDWSVHQRVVPMGLRWAAHLAAP